MFRPDGLVAFVATFAPPGETLGSGPAIVETLADDNDKSSQMSSNAALLANTAASFARKLPRRTVAKIVQCFANPNLKTEYFFFGEDDDSSDEEGDEDEDEDSTGRVLDLGKVNMKLFLVFFFISVA